jgi:hypothetical protein
MWRSFTALGLGVRFRWFDWALMVGVLVFVPLISSSPVEMRDTHSAYAFIRFLQFASPYCLALVALIAVILYRTTMDLGVGQLGFSLRFLLASVLLRLLTMSFGVWPPISEHYLIDTVSRSCFTASHWIFLLGMGYRWLLTVSNSEMLSRYERDPEGEVAELSRVVTSAN